MVQSLAFAMAFVSGAALTVDQAPPARLGQAIGLFGIALDSLRQELAQPQREQAMEKLGSLMLEYEP